MKCLSSDKIGRIFVLSLEPGDFVLASIRELIRKEMRRMQLRFQSLERLTSMGYTMY